VRSAAEIRGALQTFGNAAIGVVLGLGVLGVGLVLSQITSGPRSTTAPTTAPTAVPAASVGAAPTPAATPAATSSPAARTAPPRPSPIVVSAYASGGRRYAAVTAPVGYVFTAPFAGTVQIQLYQFIDGEVRVGSNVPSLPYFPYVTLASSDRRLVLRPGALDRDTQLIAESGVQVAAGASLFKTIGDGASSWSTFYDRGVTAGVIASLVAVPGEAELDALALFDSR
jgi:hypothetical protein